MSLPPLQKMLCYAEHTFGCDSEKVVDTLVAPYGATIYKPGELSTATQKSVFRSIISCKPQNYDLPGDNTYQCRTTDPQRVLQRVGVECTS